MDFLGISGPEAIIIAVVVLAVLGPKGMSEAARRIIDVHRRYQALTASFRQQSDQAMAQLRAYADGAARRFDRNEKIINFYRHRTRHFYID